MRETSNLLRRVFRRIDGAKFNAILKPANDGATNDRTTFRILFVKNPTFIRVGDVVKSDGGQTLILMQHPNDSAEETSFKVAYVESPTTWRRKFKTTDGVTGVVKEQPNWIDLGLIYINFDTPEDMPVGALNDTRYRFLTGQNVLIGDEVNGKVVKTIYNMLGVKLCFAD